MSTVIIIQEWVEVLSTLYAQDIALNTLPALFQLQSFYGQR